MKRVEIMANQSIEADLFEAFSKKGVARHYTKIPNVMGIGNSDPKMGDHIWPEENVMIVIYCEEEESVLLEEAVLEVKKHFLREGLKIFVSQC